MFEYSSVPHTVREDIPEAHRAAWTRISEPGLSWTSEQRVAIARCVRFERARRHDPPWIRKTDGGPEETSLPQAAIDAVGTIALDAHQIDRDWASAKMAELSDAAYVELIGLVVTVTAIDAFAEALGTELEPLPTATPGGLRGESPPDDLSDIGSAG